LGNIYVFKISPTDRNDPTDNICRVVSIRWRIIFYYKSENKLESGSFIVYIGGVSPGARSGEPGVPQPVKAQFVVE